MNLEQISQTCFVTHFAVDAAHTARAVYAALPFGAGYAHRMADVLCSAHLLAHLEGVCIDAIHEQIDWAHETVLGVAMQLDHCGPARAGETVEVQGFVAGIGDHSVQFEMEARVGKRRVAAGRVTFAVVARAAAGQGDLRPAAPEPARLAA